MPKKNVFITISERYQTEIPATTTESSLLHRKINTQYYSNRYMAMHSMKIVLFFSLALKIIAK